MTGSSAGAGACPICGKPLQPAYRPFCSKRCADIDLSRWLKGVYTIPGAAQEEDDETVPVKNPDGTPS